jgi:hypothetical protein
LARFPHNLRRSFSLEKPSPATRIRIEGVAEVAASLAAVNPAEPQGMA